MKATILRCLILAIVLTVGCSSPYHDNFSKTESSNTLREVSDYIDACVNNNSKYNLIECSDAINRINKLVYESEAQNKSICNDKCRAIIGYLLGPWNGKQSWENYDKYNNEECSTIASFAFDYEPPHINQTGRSVGSEFIKYSEIDVDTVKITNKGETEKSFQFLAKSLYGQSKDHIIESQIDIKKVGDLYNLRTIYRKDLTNNSDIVKDGTVLSTGAKAPVLTKCLTLTLGK